MKGKKRSEESKNKISNNIKNKKWIYNDNLELIKFINKEDIDKYLKEEWKLGFITSSLVAV